MRRRATKNGHVFEAAVWFPVPGGGRRQRYAYGATEAECREARDALLAERERERRRVARLADPSTVTVGDLARTWFERHVVKLDPSTRDFYRIACTYRIAPHLFDRPVGEVDRRTVEFWSADLLAAGCSPRTVNAAISTLRAMFGKAVVWDLVASNPVEQVDRIAEQRRAVRVYPSADVARIMAAARELPRSDRRIAPAAWIAERDAAMIATLAFTGLRLGELLALRADSIDDSWITVDAQVDARTGRVKPYTKTKRDRIVPVVGALAPTLRRYLDEHPPARRDSPVFARTVRGGHLRPGPWRALHFKRAAIAAGIPDARPHELRHTFASTMIAAGVTPARLAAWIGHADPSTTLRIYTHLFERVEVDVLRKVDATVFLDEPGRTNGPAGAEPSHGSEPTVPG